MTVYIYIHIYTFSYYVYITIRVIALLGYLSIHTFLEQEVVQESNLHSCHLALEWKIDNINVDLSKL